jgi:N-acetylneuraminate synthase
MRTPFIVAEISGNHLGSQERAIKLIDAAVRCGADAVKFQCFTPEQMADPGVIVQSGPWAGRELLQLYRETHTPMAWFPMMFAHARSSNVMPFASVFHPDDIGFLETLDCPMYKISSFELLDLPLIRHAAETGKPVVISTGMGTLFEIELAVAVAEEYGLKHESLLTLLRCVSAYPADSKDFNLVSISDLIKHFAGCKVGLSDHTLGLSCAVAAVALGATMVEKHLTLRRSDGGPDSAFSSEPEEFAAMVVACHEAHAALGEVRYGPTPSEMSSLPLRRLKGGKRGSV